MSPARGPRVADLLGQVVVDAGSVERASTVLAVPLDSLLAWVRWFVSRGSIDAACSRWPLAPEARSPERLWPETEHAYHARPIAKIERGIVDVNAARVVPHAEVMA